MQILMKKDGRVCVELGSLTPGTVFVFHDIPDVLRMKLNPYSPDINGEIDEKGNYTNRDSEDDDDADALYCKVASLHRGWEGEYSATHLCLIYEGAYCVEGSFQVCNGEWWWEPNEEESI